MILKKKLFESDINFLIASLAVVFIPFWRFGSLLTTLVLIIIFSKRLSFRKTHLKTLYFFPFALFISLLFIYKSVVTNNLGFLEKIWLLAFVPIAFAFFSEEKKNTLQLVFSISVFIAQTYSVIHSLYYSIIHEMAFSELISLRHTNEIIVFERPYIGFMSAMAILFLLFYTTRKKYLFLFKSFLIFFGLFYIIFIAAKLALLLAVLFLLIYFFLRGSWKIIISFSTVLILLFLVFDLPVSKRIEELKNDDRVYLWKNAVTMIDRDYNVFLGLTKKGFDETENTFTHINIENTNNDELKRYYKKMNKNTHNQFLSLFLSGGILAVILFSLPFIYLGYINIKNFNISNVLLIIAFLFFLGVENLLERQNGIILLGTCVGFLLSIKDETNKLKNNAFK